LDFKEATDRLTARVTLAVIAEACGAHPNSIDRARLDPGSKNYRTPPPEWQSAVVRLARDRAKELLQLAEEIGRERTAQREG
jgi:hypothetical protein